MKEHTDMINTDIDIQNNLQNLKSKIPANVTLVAVSKFQSLEKILAAYNAGQRDFGENYVQEMTDKYEQLPKDIRWHFVGHLQTNKVKYIVSFVHLIHGVDDFKLLKEINKQALKSNRVINCLLQIHIAKEETKFGLNENEFIQIMSSDELSNLKNIKIVGLMGMATNTDNKEQIREEFIYLKSLFDFAKKDIKCPVVEMKILSMGMSNDYQIAIECGSNMIRLGTLIFGERISNKN